jgi:hypothetical protein
LIRWAAFITPMTNEQTLEIWHVEANGQVFETNFAEMIACIGEGSLLRQDKVRKGNLRWIEAGKVPALIAVFNARDNGEPLPGPVVTTTTLDPAVVDQNVAANPSNPFPSQLSADVMPAVQAPAAAVCTIHPDLEAAYACDTCLSQFCKSCPKSFGGTVKICPMCGAMCTSLAAIQAAAVTEPYPGAGAPFGFGDFVNSLSYPFKFPASLIMGALMYMFFSLGQSAGGFGGMFMLVGAIVSFMLANSLTFGVLSHTVENFTQGKIGGNFMPTFDDFSIWDDVVHPFFLSIGVYLSSFGPLIVVVLVAVFMVANTVGKEMNAIQSDAAQAVNPELPYAAKAAKQSDEIKALLNKQQEAQRSRIQAMENGIENGDQEVGQLGFTGPNANSGQGNTTQLGSTAPNANAAPGTVKDPDDAEFERLNNMIQQQRKAQLEAAVGKAPDTVAKERSDLWKRIIGYGALFLLLGGICLLWGVFYFPAACAVAGYTGSFAATLNPTVGLDTIRHLGFDYVKILLMGILLFVMSGFITGVVGAGLTAFDMPGVGNLPAKAVGSLFGFYFSVVFSCVIGFALFKAADRLKLYR